MILQEAQKCEDGGGGGGGQVKVKGGGDREESADTEEVTEGIFKGDGAEGGDGGGLIGRRVMDEAVEGETGAGIS
jgi:hypothetical protein